MVYIARFDGNKACRQYETARQIQPELKVARSVCRPGIGREFSEPGKVGGFSVHLGLVK